MFNVYISLQTVPQAVLQSELVLFKWSFESINNKSIYM